MASRLTNGSDNRVFISYSHADRKWLDRLLDHLAPLVREGAILVWADTSIRVGADWKREIRSALDSAWVAVLLVSHHFLASDFIMDEEIPRLLAAAESKGTTIMPVIVGPSLFSETPSLARFQAVNPPSKPLSAMKASEREETLVRLAREIRRLISEDH